MWQLVINGPGYFDTSYDLPEGVTHLGRADENDIVLSGDLVSRRHARVNVKGDSIQFEDLGSRNGSKINGQVVTGTNPVKAGDALGVGENTLVVRQPTRVENAATEMVDADSGGVKRFGRGSDIGKAVVMAREAGDSGVRRVLDNFKPGESSAPPVPSSTSGEYEPHTVELDPGVAPPAAWQSLTVMYRVAEQLATAPTLAVFLEKTCDLVMERVGATTAVVLLRHATGVMVPATVRHGKQLKGGEVPVSDAVIDAVLSQGRALAVADVRDDSRFADRESVVLYGVDQVLCTPIGHKAPWSGVLYLNRSTPAEEAVEGLLDVCTAVAQLVQTGVEKFQAKPGKDDKLRQTLERFHAPDIVERRVAELKEAGGPLTKLEEKQVTVLFVDIADFTALSKTLKPDRVVDLLNEFYTCTTHIIFSFEGTVDKFLGDAVMALFGAPYSKGDDAIRAVRAASALSAEWDRVMGRRPSSERCRLKMGLNTGKVLAGTVGSEARLDYTAVGEAVNVAAWLCASGAAGQVLMTGKTLAAVGARFDVTPLGERYLLGSKMKTAVFEVVEEDSDSGTLSGVR